ncbi:lysophospholipid acyltransferase, partial [Quaeritorhiza haematococci]
MSTNIIEHYLQEAERATGLPSVIFRAAIQLIIAYPFALLFNLIPARFRTMRHLYSLFISAVLFSNLFTLWGFGVLVADALLVYFVTLWGRKNPWTPVLVFIYAMGHLSWNHLHAQIFSHDDARLDHTTPMMVSVIKLTSFAWCAHDGAKLKKEKDENGKDLHPSQKRRAIVEMPSLIEYLGYMFFFGGFLVGPSFEFKDYKDFIDQRPPFDSIPSSAIPTLKCIGTAAAYFGLMIFLEQTYTFQHALLDPKFQASPFWYRFLFINLASFVARTKYYGAWKLSEGVCNLVGVGYNGVDEQKKAVNGSPIHKWNRVQNVAIRRIELGENIKGISGSWNINTGEWLRNYVYLRLPRTFSFGSKKNKTASNGTNGTSDKPNTPSTASGSSLHTLITFMVSAFWHGFYPGFYLFFASASLMNICG